jgi:hypothetical protein
MRLQTLHFQLAVVLTLAILCNPLHASPAQANAGAPQQQQPSAKAAPVPDAADQGPPDDDASNLSDQVIQDVLEPLRTGMETQNIKQVMSVFDKSQMTSYGDLEQQVQAFVRQYQEIHFRYRILQATAQNDHASSTVEIDMDAMPYQTSMIPARRSVQARFQLKQEPKGWRVVSFSPSDLFSLSNYSGTDTQ